MTLLFSDSNELKKEKTYYDALNTFQSEFGYGLTELVISESTNRHVLDYYAIESFPTMLVYIGEDEKIRITGEQEPTLIQSELETLFNEHKKPL